MIGPVQANLKVYNSTSISLIESCALYHLACKTTQPLTFSTTDIEGSVLLSCGDACELELVLASDKLDTKIPSSAKLTTNHTDRSDANTINRKTQGNSGHMPINKQPQWDGK